MEWNRERKGKEERREERRKKRKGNKGKEIGEKKEKRKKEGKKKHQKTIKKSINWKWIGYLHSQKWAAISISGLGEDIRVDILGPQKRNPQSQQGDRMAALHFTQRPPSAEYTALEIQGIFTKVKGWVSGDMVESFASL